MASKQTSGIGSGKRGPGRPKGVPNKINGQVKEMILAALEKAGGIDYLATQAVESPTAFLALVGKVLPLQVTGENGGPLKAALTVTFEDGPGKPSGAP